MLDVFSIQCIGDIIIHTLYSALGRFSSMHRSDIMICVGDVMSALEGLQSIGGYHECIVGVQCTAG